MTGACLVRRRDGQRRHWWERDGAMRNNTLKTCSIVMAMSLLLPPAAGVRPGRCASASQRTYGPMPPPNRWNASTAAFNPEQLDALLAPIALYPDTLLVQVLMASTFPLQIVTASRWLAEGDNKIADRRCAGGGGGKTDVGPSVMSLVPFPQALAMMNDKLDWTQQLGYCVRDAGGRCDGLRAATAAAGAGGRQPQVHEQQVSSRSR